MDSARPASGCPRNVPACRPSDTTATPRAVPMPRVMFTIPPAAAASRAGTDPMISALLAGVYMPRPDAEQAEQRDRYRIGSGRRQRGGAAGRERAAEEAPGPVRPAGRDQPVDRRGGEAESGRQRGQQQGPTRRCRPERRSPAGTAPAGRTGPGRRRARRRPAGSRRGREHHEPGRCSAGNATVTTLGVELPRERAEADRGDREPRGQRVLADHGRPGRFAQQRHHDLAPAAIVVLTYICNRTIISSNTELN